MRRIAPLLVLLAVPAASGCGSDAASSSGGGCSYPADGQAAKKVDPPKASAVATSGTVTSVLDTNVGTVSITMDRAKAPCTVHSFESLAAQGFFNQTRCHRLTTEGIFVLQCGDPTGSGSGGPGYSFADEKGGPTSYTKGVVAMANSGPNTNGSQFFLVYADSTLLDKKPDYTIFGQLDAASVAVLAKVAARGSDPPGDGQPVQPVTLTKVTTNSSQPAG